MLADNIESDLAGLIAGVWGVCNPDRGQFLGDGRLLLIGGTYEFLADNHCNAHHVFRTDDSSAVTENYLGRWRLLPGLMVELEFPGQWHELFRICADGRMMRLFTFRAAGESELFISKA